MGQRDAGVAVERSPCIPCQENVRRPPPLVLIYLRNLFSSPSASYVFENYTWDKTDKDFSTYNRNPIPARVPLTALLSGTPLFPPILRTLHPYSETQAQLPEIPFHHPRIRHPRSFLSSSIKYALTALLSIARRSTTLYRMLLPRLCYKRGSTNSNRRMIVASG